MIVAPVSQISKDSKKQSNYSSLSTTLGENPMAKPNYGIDAPTVLRNLSIGAGTGIIGGLVLIRYVGPIGRPFVSMGLGCGFGGLLLLWSSLFGKFRARDALLNSVPWRGDEQVLDVGCGHGLMLIGAAKRLTTGRATGIDIWQDVDQANNSAEATPQRGAGGCQRRGPRR